MRLELLFLGTGTSAGIPMIGCECEVCTSSDPRDTRTRPSVLIRYPRASANGEVEPAEAGSADTAEPAQLLVDTAPELREQVVRHRIRTIDGVLYTHNHADHIFGIDDLRRFNAVMQRPIDLYAEPRIIKWLRETFGYIFEPHRNVNKSFIPQLIPQPINPSEPFDLCGGRWTPLRLMHGHLPILGFRVDAAGAALAYCTDVSGIPPETYPHLRDLDVLVIDGLRYRHHPTHLTVDQALEQIERIAPRRAYLTHMAHDVRHAELEARLPEGVHLAFDGLRVHCDGR